MAAVAPTTAFTLFGAAWTLAAGVTPILIKATANATALDRRKLSVAILLVGSEVFGFLVLAAIFFAVFWGLLARRPADTSEDEKQRRVRIGAFSASFWALVTATDSLGAKQDSDLEASRAKAIETSSLTTAAGALAGTVVQIVSGVVSTVGSSVSNVLAFALPLLVLSGFAFLAYGIRTNLDDVVPYAVSAWQCTIRPLAIDFLVLPLTNVVLVMIPALALGIAVLLYRVYNILMWGPPRVLLTFIVTNFFQYATLFGKFVASLVLGLVFWFSNNPLYTQFPLDEPLLYVFQFAYELYAGSILPSCRYLRYVVGGIGEALVEPSLRNSVISVAQIPWTAIQQLILYPVVLQKLPIVEKFNDLTSVALQNAGFWIQNVTVIQFDIYLGQIRGYVNGTIPIPQPPGSYIQYFVNFLKSRYAETVGLFFAAASSIFWEALRLIFYAQSWFRLGGNTFLTFEMLRVSLINFFDSAEALVDIAPQCVIESSPFYNQAQGIKFGGIIGGLGRALVALVYTVKDLGLGELYTLLEFKKWPGYFSALYFVSNASRLQEYTAQIARFATSLGCAVGLLDVGIGRFLQSLLTVFLNLGIRVPVYMLAYVRWAYEQGNPSILDLLDDTPTAPLNALETEALQISNVATFIYRFDNADSATCETRLSFICGLGKTLESLVQIFIRGFLLVLRSIKNVVKAFVSLTSTGQLGAVTPLDISGFNQTAYKFGCRLGTTVAFLIPIDLTCHATRSNFCAVREFRTLPSRQTPNTCMATFACRLGNYLAVGPELVAIFLQYGSTFQFIGGSSPLISVIRNIYAIFIDKILSPLCPFAHAVDCWLSAIIQSDVTVTSQFLCLINSFLIKLGTIFRDTIVQIIELFFYVVQGVFGGFTAGTFTRIITLFFSIVGVTFQQILFSIIGLFLGWVTAIIEAICGLICICWQGECDACKGCRNVVAYLKGQSSNFFNPDDSSNYLKRSLNEHERRNVEEEYIVLNMSIALQKAFGFMYETNMTYSNGTWEIYRTYRTVLYDDLPTHYATYVKWTPGTDCYYLMRALNHTVYSDLGIAEKDMMRKCLRAYAAAIAIADSTPYFSWLPMDIFDNWIRVIDIGAKIMRYVTVAAQFLFDKITPREIVMSDWYRTQWQGLMVNSTHYTNEFRRVFPGFGLSELQYVTFDAYVQALELEWYLKRNMPEIFDPEYVKTQFANNPAGITSYAEMLHKSYTQTGDYLYSLANLQYNHTLMVSTNPTLLLLAEGVDPATNMSLSDGSYYSTTSIYKWNNVSNVRSEIYNAYGDEYVNQYDDVRATTDLYLLLGKGMNALRKMVDDFMNTWGVSSEGLDFHDVLDASNYLDRDADYLNKAKKKRAVEIEEEMSGKREPRVVVDPYKNEGKILSFSQVMDAIWQSAASRVDDFMVVNGAANADWSDMHLENKKRSLDDSDEYTNPVPAIETLDRSHRIVIAIVGAASSAVKLNTTYVPYWCDLSKVNESMTNCSVKYDWTLSTKFLDPEFNASKQFDYLANETSNLITDVLQARTPEAAGARKLSASIVSGLTNYGIETVARMQRHIDNENIPILMQSVRSNWERAKRDMESSRANTEATETVLYNAKESEAAAYRWRTFYEEKEDFQRWKSKFEQTGTYKDYVEGNSTTQWRDDAMSYANYLIEETTANPASNVPLSTLNISDPTRTGQTFRQSTGLNSAVLRAATQFFLEETKMIGDRDKYSSLFTTTTPFAPETALLSQQVWMDKRTITIQSVAFRRKLYEQTTGRAATMHDDRVPIVQIKTHQEALLVDRRHQLNERLMMLSQSTEKTAVDEAKELETHISLLKDGRQYSLAASASSIGDNKEFIKKASAAASRPGVVRVKNVVEIRVLQNKVGSSYLGSRQNRIATSASSWVGSQFFFPESRNESIDFARSILGCQLGDATLCEECIAIDYVVGKIISQVLWTIGYYTTWFVAAFFSCVDFLLYTFNLSTTVRIGYGSYPVRFPARGIGVSEWFRFTPREAEGFPFDWGPKIDWFVEELIGVPLPNSLVQNGTLYSQLEVYLQERAAGTTDLSILFEVFNFIENVLHIPVLQLVDTVIDFVISNYQAIASSIYDKYACDYATDLDCSKRTFSWVGGWIQILTILFAVFLFTFIFVSPIAAGVVLTGSLPFLIPIHMVITYGWSFGCAPFIPQCYTKDTFDFIAYTVFNKCSPLLGMFISNTDYNLNTCTQCANGFGSALYNGSSVAIEGPHCDEHGFNNLYDGLDVFSWYWEAYGLSPHVFEVLKVVADVAYNVLNLVSFGLITKPVPTQNWRKDKFPTWAASDPMYANFVPCSLTTLAQGYLGLAAQVLAAGAVYFPIVQFGVSTLASIALTAGSFIGFINLVNTNAAAASAYIAKNVVDFQLSPRMIKYTIFGSAARNAAASAGNLKKSEFTTGDGDDDDDDDDDKDSDGEEEEEDSEQIEEAKLDEADNIRSQNAVDIAVSSDTGFTTIVSDATRLRKTMMQQHGGHAASPEQMIKDFIGN